MPDRRNLLLALAGGAALLLFATARNSPLAAPSIHVPKVSVVQAKLMLDAGAIAIDARDAQKYAYLHLARARLVPLKELWAGGEAVAARGGVQPGLQSAVGDWAGRGGGEAWAAEKCAGCFN